MKWMGMDYNQRLDILTGTDNMIVKSENAGTYTVSLLGQEIIRMNRIKLYLHRQV